MTFVARSRETKTSRDRLAADREEARLAYLSAPRGKTVRLHVRHHPAHAVRRAPVAARAPLVLLAERQAAVLRGGLAVRQEIGVPRVRHARGRAGLGGDARQGHGEKGRDERSRANRPAVCHAPVRRHPLPLPQQ
jgi:hypothetical protein